MTRGNFAVAVIRMLLLLAASRKSVRRDRLERANELLTQQEPFATLGEETRTRIIHQQNLIVEFEPEQALATLPKLVPRAEDRPRAIELCRYVTGSDEEMAPETREVLDRIRTVLEIHEPAPEPAKPKRLARVAA
jgi:tellurite resistance protein